MAFFTSQRQSQFLTASTRLRLARNPHLHLTHLQFSFKDDWWVRRASGFCSKLRVSFVWQPVIRARDNRCWSRSPVAGGTRAKAATILLCPLHRASSLVHGEKN